MTYDISLTWNQQPRYPNRCVVCERENPETTAEIVVLVSIRTRSISTELAETVLFGASNSNQNQHVRLRPPACLHCSRSINRQGWYALIGQYTFPLLGVLCFVVLLAYGYFGLGIVAMFAGIAWPAITSTVWPPAIGATGIGSNVVYEFRSAKFSKEFEELNCTDPKIAKNEVVHSRVECRVSNDSRND
jgi:hypothetical protein